MAKTKTPQRRTHRERREATTEALLQAARVLFAQDGYTATSLDEVVAKAGLTKGALYHHFDGKKALFEAVFLAEQDELMRQITDVYWRKEDSWAAFQAGAIAFLDGALDPEVQQIILVDAPGALGWERVRELEADGTLELMKIGLKRAMDADRIERRPVDPLANLLFGAICEGVMSVARKENQNAAARAVRAELRRLLAALETVD